MQKVYKPITKKSRLRRFIRNSITVSFLTHLSVKLHTFFKDKTSKVFASSETADKAKDTGFFAAFLCKTRPFRFFAPLKRAFAKSVEQSAAIRAYRFFIKKFFAASVRSFGVFCVSAGLYSLLAYAIKIYMAGGVPRTQTDAVAIALLVLVGGFLIFSKKSLGRKMSESAFFTFLLETFGINKLAINAEAPARNHFPAAFFSGLAFGIAGFFFSPAFILSRMAAYGLLFIIMYSPESGLLAAMAALPFGNEKWLLTVLASTFVSYILKLLRGKRNFTFQSEDILSLFFAFIFVLSFPGKTTSLFFLASAYFMASNLMRTVAFLQKSALCLSLGLFLKSLVTSALFIFDLFGIDILRVSGLSLGGSLRYDEFTVIAAVSFSVFLLYKTETRLFSVVRFLFVLSAFFNLFVSLSDRVWILSLLCLFVYLVFRTVLFFNVLFVFAVAAPVIYFVRDIELIFHRVAPFGAAGLFSQPPDLLSLLFGGGNFGGLGLYGLALESFGVLGLTLGGAFLLFLASRSFTSSNLARGGEIRGLCAIFSAFLLAFLLLGLAAGQTGQTNGFLAFWVGAGLISATGHAVFKNAPAVEHAPTEHAAAERTAAKRGAEKRRG